MKTIGYLQTIMRLHWSIRAKNHISAEELYFATFFYNCFQCFGANIGHFFEADDKKILGIHYHKRIKFVCMKDEDIAGDWKCVVTIILSISEAIVS